VHVTATTAIHLPNWAARLVPAAAYVGTRLVGLVVLQVLAAVHHRDLVDVLRSWDGDWFVSISQHGYDSTGSNHMDANGNRASATSMAFFPGYPFLIGLVNSLTAVDPALAGLAISLAAGVAASYGITRLCANLPVPAGTGLICVVLFACSPMSVTLSMVYTEALFCALAVWALVGVLERRWWLAALCCAAAGLVRPTAGVLIVVVCTAVVLAVVRKRAPWHALLVLPVCLSGFGFYFGWVSARTGTLTGWFELQRAGWGTAFDGGQSTLVFLAEVFTSDSSVMETANVLVMLGALTLAVVTVARRLPWPVVWYGIGVLVMTMGSSGITYSKMRLLVPAFTLLIPLATGLAKRRPTTVAAVLAGCALLGGWIGGYALTGWRYAI
jgi:hypothetical protein